MKLWGGLSAARQFLQTDTYIGVGWGNCVHTFGSNVVGYSPEGAVERGRQEYEEYTDRERRKWRKEDKEKKERQQ